MIKGICLILLFYFLGEAASYCLGGFIPGSVCGMILLFCALSLHIVNPNSVKQVANVLTRNMSLFFIPVGVGVMANYGIIAQNWVALCVIATSTTLLVLWYVGATTQYLDRCFKNRHKTDSK